MIPPPWRGLPRLALRDGTRSAGVRAAAEEAPVAITYNGETHAVLMATPADLEDLGLGFTLTEGLAASLEEIEGPETVAHEHGLEVRMWLPPERLARRRRSIVGPTGCGLCGIESLQQAVPPCPPVRSNAALAPEEIEAAVAALGRAQPLGRETRAAHAAGLWTRAAGLVAAREDVGRHNALDKLAGALARVGADASQGIVALTSRVSVEMVQKAAAIGAPVIAAVSAPTALAVRVAQAAGITLAAVVRDDGFELFTHPERVA